MYINKKHNIIKFKINSNYFMALSFIVGALSLLSMGAMAVQAQQANQGLVQAVSNIENFLMGPVSKLVIYSVFTLSFVAALAKQNTFGVIFAMIGAFAYHQVSNWVNNTFTLLV